MKSFTFSLNCEIQAHDAEEAIKIAQTIRDAALKQEYIVDIDIDDIEEL